MLVYQTQSELSFLEIVDKAQSVTIPSNIVMVIRCSVIFIPINASSSEQTDCVFQSNYGHCCKRTAFTSIYLYSKYEIENYRKILNSTWLR